MLISGREKAKHISSDLQDLTFLQGRLTAARGPHAAQDGSECGPTQNHQFT